MLSQVVYLGLFWLVLILLLNPGVSIGNLTKRYLKPRWWLIINSMWIWVVIPHHLETALHYPTISVTGISLKKIAYSTQLTVCITLNQMIESKNQMDLY